jgi:hypothetical protein
MRWFHRKYHALDKKSTALQAQQQEEVLLEAAVEREFQSEGLQQDIAGGEEGKQGEGEGEEEDDDIEQRRHESRNITPFATHLNHAHSKQQQQKRKKSVRLLVTDNDHDSKHGKNKKEEEEEEMNYTWRYYMEVINFIGAFTHLAVYFICVPFTSASSAPFYTFAGHSVINILVSGIYLTQQLIVEEKEIENRMSIIGRPLTIKANANNGHGIAGSSNEVDKSKTLSQRLNRTSPPPPLPPPSLPPPQPQSDGNHSQQSRSIISRLSGSVMSFSKMQSRKSRTSSGVHHPSSHDIDTFSDHSSEMLEMRVTTNTMHEDSKTRTNNNIDDHEN